MDQEDAKKSPDSQKTDFATVLNEKVLTENDKKAKSILKIILIILGVIITIELITMIIFFAVNGFPT